MTVDAPPDPSAPGTGGTDGVTAGAAEGATDDATAGGDAADGRGAPERGRRVGRLVIAAVVVALVSMWGYVVYLAFGPGRQPPLDRLDDPAFAEAAEERCAEALERIEELPVASATPDPVERAEVLDAANAAYEAMLDDLDRLTRLVPDPEQRGYAEEWLADWRLHLNDRREYADALRRDPNARLLVSEKPGEGRHVTAWIDEFALANRMPSCASPTDA